MISRENFELSRWFSMILDQLTNLLAYKFFPIVLLFLAVLLAWPLIYTGWFTDDFYQRAAYVDTPDAQKHQPLGKPLKGPMQMYAFFDGDSECFQRMLDYGNIPWWYSPDIKAALWRPITALFCMLDFWLWPQSPESMHVQSLCWFAILILLSGLVYRKVMGAGWAAGLAVLLYTINDIQVIPIAFLANRHILIAAVFGIGSIGAYFLWRGKNLIGWAYAAIVLYTGSLFASESGVAVFGYMMSHSLWIERGKAWTRIKPLLPFAIITILWRILYTTLGYGIAGVSDLHLYVDPASDPMQFIFAVIEKIPMTLLHCVAFPPSDFGLIAIVSKLYWVLLVAVLCFLGFLFFPLFRSCRISLFWLFGAVFSAIPLCAALPGGRSLALVSFGMTGFLSQMIDNAVTARKAAFFSAYRRYFILIVLFGFVILRLTIGSYTLNQTPKLLQMAQKGVMALANLPIDDPDPIHQDVVLVNPPITVFTVYVIPLRLIERKPLPAHIRTLCSGMEEIELKRTDANTLVVRPKDGYMPPPQWNQISLWNLRSYPTLITSLRYIERLFITRKNPFTLGQLFELTGVAIHITELSVDNRPMEATFVFDRALEDQSLRWLQWNKKKWKYETFTPPDIGETITLQ